MDKNAYDNKIASKVAKAITKHKVVAPDFLVKMLEQARASERKETTERIIKGWDKLLNDARANERKELIAELKRIMNHHERWKAIEEFVKKKED